MHCTYRTLLNGVFASPLSRTATLPPSFLLPSFATQNSTFSTSAIRAARKRGSPGRAVSALRRTGVKHQKLSVSLDNLPQPRLDPAKRSSVRVDKDHGLWGFLYGTEGERIALPTPEQLKDHGRGWAVSELRKKSWEDLHKLWWVCVKEMNRLRTFDSERERIGNLYGQYESDQRKDVIKKTQKSIMAVLTERWNAWQNARTLAMEDPEINMYADVDSGEPAYLPHENSSEEIPETDKSLAPPDTRPTNEARV